MHSQWKTLIAVCCFVLLGCGEREDLGTHDGKQHYRAFLSDQLGGDGNTSSLSRIWRYCRRHPDAAVNELVNAVANHDSSDDPYFLTRVQYMVQVLPLYEAPRHLVLHINGTWTTKKAKVAAVIYEAYYSKHPTETFVVPEDKSVSTSANFANVVFNCSCHRALERFVLGPDVPEDKTERRDLVRLAIWADHLFKTIVWKSRNRYEITEAERNECRAQLATLAESEYWWARRYVAQVSLLRTSLCDESTVKRLREDRDARVSMAFDKKAKVPWAP